MLSCVELHYVGRCLGILIEGLCYPENLFACYGFILPLPMDSCGFHEGVRRFLWELNILETLLRFLVSRDFVSRSCAILRTCGHRWQCVAFNTKHLLVWNWVRGTGKCGLWYHRTSACLQARVICLLGINFIFILILNKGYWALVNVAFITTKHLPVYRLQARVICLVGIHFLYRVLGTG